MCKHKAILLVQRLVKSIKKNRFLKPEFLCLTVIVPFIFLPALFNLPIVKRLNLFQLV